MKATGSTTRSSEKGSTFGVTGGATKVRVEEMMIGCFWARAGSWKENNMHGKGVYQWKDGRIYQGDYLNDKKHGFGIYTW